jgi:hypothetical protein
MQYMAEQEMEQIFLPVVVPEQRLSLPWAVIKSFGTVSNSETIVPVWIKRLW